MLNRWNFLKTGFYEGIIPASLGRVTAILCMQPDPGQHECLIRRLGRLAVFTARAPQQSSQPLIAHGEVLEPFCRASSFGCTLSWRIRTSPGGGCGTFLGNWPRAQLAGPAESLDELGMSDREAMPSSCQRSRAGRIIGVRVGVWRSGSAPVLGTGGRRFDPGHPDQSMKHFTSARRSSLRT